MERWRALNTATMSMRTHLALKQHKTPWITFRGYSRSHILGSLKSRRETAYYCIIMWALESEILKKRSEHLCFREPYSHSVPPLSREPLLIFTQTLLWIYHHSYFAGGLRKTTFSARVHFGLSISSKVIDFDTNRKRVCDFLLVRRFRDIAGFVLMIPPLFHPNFEGVSVGPDRRCWDLCEQVH